MKYSIGLKLWSINKNYINEARRLYGDGVYNYIELFAVPGSYDNVAHLWRGLDIPYVIHAPHFAHGFNFARQECCEKNKQLTYETLKFADALDAKFIIFHPGINGQTEETAQQLKRLFDPRMLIENKPYYTIDRKLRCNGYSPEEIKYLINETGVGFCCDIGHAIYAANAQKLDGIEYLKKFLKINPKIFHLSDGDWDGLVDKHNHLGDGSFKFEKIVEFLPAHCLLTLETPHDFEEKLHDFEEDVNFIKKVRSSYEDRFMLTRACIDDMKEVFNLSNDLVVRANSHNQSKILFDDHLCWYKKKIQNPRCFFYVIKENSENFCGYIRFDLDACDEGAYVVTMHLAENYRAKGIGTMILLKAMSLFFQQSGTLSVYAYIKNANEASRRCFLRAGYRVIGEKNIKATRCTEMICEK